MFNPLIVKINNSCLRILLNKKRSARLLPILIFFHLSAYAQIANFISNGGFEEKFNCTGNNVVSKAKCWSDLDSLNQAVFYSNFCYGNIPNNGFGFQYPNSGEAFCAADFFTDIVTSDSRAYIKNRLKQPLNQGVSYCVKFYANIGNNSTYGIDGFGAYFGDNSLDTISRAHIPLTFLTPQIQNPSGNIITDTLNWTVVTGTFTSLGTEKFMIIGNFKSDSTVGKLFINPTYTPLVFCSVSIDDVSCIPIDLPAHAGPDVSVVPGNSVYIGRPKDVGIDEACTWFKLPGSVPIATAAGIWVSPTQTSTYVVQQQIWCGTVKYDTVVVFMNPLGLSNSLEAGNGIKVFPVPAKDNVELSIENTSLIGSFKKLFIYNTFGALVREEDIFSKEKRILIKTNDLLDGIYFLQLINNKNETVSKRFVISR